MNIIVDIGNSRVKVVAFEGGCPVGEHVADEPTREWLREVVAHYPSAERAIVSTTRGDAEEVCRLLREWIAMVLLFDPATTPVPLGNDYLTPQTLGADRLAAAVGAEAMYPGCDIMIVDFGTAITIDYVEEGSFRGGNIAPGMSMRFKALNHFTAKLPLCGATEQMLRYGRTTTEAIEQGVMQGITHEIEGYIAAFMHKYAKKIIIFTGGDAKYFAKRIKNAIFADCEPVIYGLNTILEYNAEIR